MKYQVVEIVSKEPFSAKAYGLMSLEEAGALYGQRMIRSLGVYLIDEYGAVIAEQQVDQNYGYAPPQILAAANLRFDHYVVAKPAGIGWHSDSPIYLDIDGNITRLSEEIHGFSSKVEASIVAKAFMVKHRGAWDTRVETRTIRLQETALVDR